MKKYLLLLLIFLLTACGSPQIGSDTIDVVKIAGEEIQEKTALEKSNDKADEIVKFDFKGKHTKENTEVEILDLTKINGGVSVMARAWNDGEQLGFSKDGSVDIERFIIVNPPTLIPDKNGDIIREVILDEETKLIRYRKDPYEATKEVMFQAVVEKGKKNTKIIKDKVGQTTYVIYPSLDGFCYQGNVNPFSTAHDSSTCNTVGYTESFLTTYYAFDGAYFIGRLFFLHDSTVITATDTIDSATLGLYVYGKNDTNAGSWSLVASTPAADDAIVAGDFDQLGTTKGATDVAVADMTTSAYNYWTLDDIGLPWVKKDDITRLGIRQAKDISNTAPTGYNSISIYFSERDGTTEDPKLTVETTPGATPPPKVFQSYIDF